jgi:hypothetical protein
MSARYKELAADLPVLQVQDLKSGVTDKTICLYLDAL